MTHPFSALFTAIRLSARLLALGGLLALFMTSCQPKKVAADPAKGLSDKIQSIVPKAVLDDMRAKGLVINEGSQPPQLDGIFIASPYTLLSPYGPEDNWQQGRVIGDYKFRFYDQVGDDVKLDIKQSNETATGLRSFVSGFGNKFTIFAQTKGVQSGIGTTQLSVVSGELSANGITNFQYAFTIITKNGDTRNETLIPVGKARVWKDGNQVANKTTTFRMAAPDAGVPTLISQPGATGSVR